MDIGVIRDIAMLNAKQRAMMDQSIAALSEMLPDLWWGLFQGCVEKGFSEEQAIELIKQYVASDLRITDIDDD